MPEFRRNASRALALWLLRENLRRNKTGARASQWPICRLVS
jgi:hypothetical protein